MYLLDSNICIDFMRGELPYAYDMMRNSSPKLFKIPAIVEGELRLGIEKSKQPEKARWLVDEFTLPFEVVPFDSKCAHAYARIRGELEMTGKKIGPNDLLIAATALANNAVIAGHQQRGRIQARAGAVLGMLVRDGVGRISVRRLVSRSIISGSHRLYRNARRTHA